MNDKLSSFVALDKSSTKINSSTSISSNVISKNTNFFPNIKQAIWLSLLVYIYMAILILIYSRFIHRPYPHPLEIGVFYALAIVLVLLSNFRKSGMSFKCLFNIKILFSLFFASLIVLFIGISILLSSGNNFIRYLIPPPYIFDDHLREYIKTSLFSTILVLSVMAPIYEEFFFRGFFLQSFLRQYSTKKSIIASALLFSIFHLNPHQLFPAFIWGIVLAWIFVETEAVVYCMICHSIINSMGLFNVAMNIRLEGFNYTEIVTKIHPGWLELAGLIMIVSSGLILRIRSVKDKVKYTKHD